jgi:drug/metabolite transporter (DMT)-like permease
MPGLTRRLPSSCAAVKFRQTPDQGRGDGERLTRHAVHPHRLAFPALLLGNAALAFGPWLVRLSDVGAVAVGFWRLALALPFLLFLGRIAGQPAHWPRRALIITVAIAAVFYSLDLAAWNAGIRMTKLGNATLFGNSGSFVFAVYGLLLAHRAPSLKQGGSLILALGGAALLMSSSYELSPKNFTGDLLTLVAGLFYGGYLIFVERGRTQLRPLPLLILATAFSVPMLLAISLSLGERILPHDWTPLLIFALSSQVVGQGLLVYSIGTLPPLVVGLGLLTQPAISATIGWLAYRESLSLTDIIGAIAIASALVIVRLPDRGLRASTEPPS